MSDETSINLIRARLTEAMLSKGLSLKDAEARFNINESSTPKDYCIAYIVALQDNGYLVSNKANHFDITLTTQELKMLECENNLNEKAYSQEPRRLI